MDDRLDAAVAALAAKQFGFFSRQQAMEAGATRDAIRWRVRTGRWVRAGRDVFRIAGAPVTWHGELWAALLDAGAGAVVSHRSAAALLGIPGFRQGPVEISRRESQNHRVALGRLHQTFWLPEHHTRVIGGLRTTSLARTLCDLAGSEHPLRVRRAVDTSLHRLGLALPELVAVHASLARRGRDGTVVMREIVRERDGEYTATESELEDLFVQVLEARGVPVPERQVTLGDDERAVGRVDFFNRDATLVVELNSRTYHDSLLQADADAVRAAELAALGLRYMPVRYRQLVDDPDGVVERYVRACGVVAV
jgi:very-short-patch-repair endonuclease